LVGPLTPTLFHKGRESKDNKKEGMIGDSPLNKKGKE